MENKIYLTRAQTLFGGKDFVGSPAEKKSEAKFKKLAGRHGNITASSCVHSFHEASKAAEDNPDMARGRIKVRNHANLGEIIGRHRKTSNGGEKTGIGAILAGACNYMADSIEAVYVTRNINPNCVAEPEEVMKQEIKEEAEKVLV